MDYRRAFTSWVSGIHPTQRGDPLWRMRAYQLALYGLYLGWDDAIALDRVRVTRPIASQLYRALGSVAANIAEGYGRSSGADRVRLFEYGLGSGRESAVWYWAGRPVLGPALIESRLELQTEIRRMLLAAIPQERARRVRQTNHRNGDED